ncbi:MAG: CRISPR-associated helicase/endonuclease Cas3 [Gammaproteobacteria bacterium]|nr:CRISPR-associated helicase/endonuclease Cas3 [Gammaproteobacteria bacterium]MCP5426089.1 CRISPR-associated helicase/endonuclease Cas3 [Gammaproteobacteria bacterium]
MFRYWGKAATDYPGQPNWHPLLYHALDVTAVAAAWWDADPAIRATFSKAFQNGPITEPQLLAWILYFTALHDLGKFDVCFQLKASPVVREIWSELDFDDVDISKRNVADFNHGSWGFRWGLKERDAWTGITDWPVSDEDSWRSWLQAVTGHHGEFPQDSAANREYEAADHVLEHDRQARHAFVLAVAELFLARNGIELGSLPPPCTLASQDLLAGFCSVCDWIGSNTDVMPYRFLDQGLPLERYFAERVSELRQRKWLYELGVIGQPSAYRTLSALLKPGETPRGVQVLVDGLDAQPGMLLIEAPTGSGKTEAALAHAWRWLAGGTAHSIVFALPTQATANAMLKRAEAFAEKAFSGDAANVVLAHGKRDYHDGFERLVRAGYRTTAQGAHEAGVQCSTWLAQSRKRIFLGQLGVCTVDQVLLSVLPVRHKFVRGFGINRSVLIVDEVHAYDSYMHGLLAEVLSRQRAVGGSAILLSATLPSKIRNQLLAAWGSVSAEDAPYPVLWQAIENRAQPIPVPDKQRPPHRAVSTKLQKTLEAMPDAALMTEIVAAAKSGARVAVVCNLVDNAQRLARQLRENAEGVPIDMFHARYRFVDRQAKETAVLNQYGREAPRGTGRILVATQVVEQSLDLDFDWLITQICPVDLLFQRIGRLHRHERVRPQGFEQPCCTVLSVEAEDYGLFELIYGNARVLWRTEQLLVGNPRIDFPKAYRDWIELVYGEEWDGEPEAITQSYCEFSGRQMAAAMDARQMVSLQRKPFSDDDVQITVKTRDGEMNVTVLALRDDGRCLDGTSLEGLEDRVAREVCDMNSIPVPKSWEKLFSGSECDEDGRYQLVFSPSTERGWTTQTGKATFCYSEEFGLEKKTDGPT